MRYFQNLVAGLSEQHSHVSDLSSNSYCIFRNVFSNEQIGLLRSILSTYFASSGRFNYGGKFELRGMHAVKEISQVLSTDNFLNSLNACTHPNALLLTGECDLNVNTLGEWHKDITKEMFLGDHIYADPHWTIYKVAIFPQAQDLHSSGVLKLRPGSHMRIDGSKIHTEPLQIRAGDVIVFDVRIDHAGQSPSLEDKLLHVLLKMAGYCLRADAERWFTLVRSRIASYAFRVNRLTSAASGNFAALSNYDAATIRRGYVL